MLCILYNTHRNGFCRGVSGPSGRFAGPRFDSKPRSRFPGPLGGGTVRPLVGGRVVVVGVTASWHGAVTDEEPAASEQLKDPEGDEDVGQTTTLIEQLSEDVDLLEVGAGDAPWGLELIVALVQDLVELDLLFVALDPMVASNDAEAWATASGRPPDLGHELRLSLVHFGLETLNLRRQIADPGVLGVQRLRLMKRDALLDLSLVEGEADRRHRDQRHARHHEGVDRIDQPRPPAAAKVHGDDVAEHRVRQAPRRQSHNDGEQDAPVRHHGAEGEAIAGVADDGQRHQPGHPVLVALDPLGLERVAVDLQSENSHQEIKKPFQISPLDIEATRTAARFIPLIVSYPIRPLHSKLLYTERMGTVYPL